ncbi:MAG: tetratricopeptide repeat protein [Nitrospinota bacterium]|nr:tetratricopeptide repeat protein [Nitrospinota bacterium]
MMIPPKTISSIFLITLLAFLAYFGTLKSPFIYDDEHAIVHNPHIQRLDHFQETVSMGHIENRPFVLLSYAINRELGGLNVMGYHLLNLLLHIFASILLFFLMAELLSLESPTSRSRLKNLPLAVALIHTFHPMAVESVAYLSSRSSLLVTLFFLLSFLYWLRFLGRWGESRFSIKNVYYLVLVGGFFFLGASSKETIATLPLIGAVYFWLKFSETPPRKKVSAILLILLPLAIYMIYRTTLVGNPFFIHTDAASYKMDRAAYFFTQLGVIVFYYGLKLLLPINLNLEPDIKMVSGLGDPVTFIAAALILLLVCYLNFEKSRLVKFAFIWAAVNILPTSSFIPIKQLAVEHRTYLPGLGITILIGMWILNRQFTTWLAKPVLPCFLFLLSLLTVQRGLDFRSEIFLWQDTAQKSPRKALVHNNLASALIKQKQYKQALQAVEKALSLDPQNISANNNKGHINYQMGRYPQAQEIFDRLIGFGVETSKVYHNAGMARVRLGQHRNAVSYFQKAVAIDPDAAFLHFALANAYKELKLYDKSLREYKNTLKYQIGHLGAYNNMGVIFWELKHFDLAAQKFRKVLTIDQNHLECNKNLACVYMLLGKFRKAIPYLKRHIEFVPEDANAKDLLLIAQTLQHEEKP